MAEDAVVPETAETTEVTPEDTGAVVESQPEETVVEQTMTSEEAFEFSKLSPAAQKEFQKLQQDRATLARQNTQLLKDRQTTKPADAAPSPLDKLRQQEAEILGEFEKLGDDLPTASLQAKLYRVQNQIRAGERQEAEARESQVEQTKAIEREQQRFETDWKRANSTIADKYQTILEQSRLEVERRNPGLDPNSMAFSAKWEARMEVMTEAAKVAVKAPVAPKTNVPPPRNPAGARPAGNVASPVAKPGAPEKIDYTKPVDPQKVQWTV